MKIPFLLLGLLALAGSVTAQNITKVSTIVVKSGRTNLIGQTIHANSTNQVFIPFGEAARVGLLKFATFGQTNVNFAEAWYYRDEFWWRPEENEIVTGPVWFFVEMTADSESQAALTLQRFKVSKLANNK